MLFATAGNMTFIISTCCHSINLLIEKHYPDAAKYLAGPFADARPRQRH
jgi:hypothetical protein